VSLGHCLNYKHSEVTPFTLETMQL